MKVYLLGAHGQSNTDGKTIVTVELLSEHTDMRGITIFNGKHITNPFYRTLKINAGRVVAITDLEEKAEFKDTLVSVNGTNMSLKVGCYFYLEPTESFDGYLTGFQYKLPVLEESNYVARGYNGVVWTHYANGNIRNKKYYKAGNLHSCFSYRDDPYNTLANVKQYHNGRVDCEFNYDNREALIKQNWYNSKGGVFHKINTGASVEQTETEQPLQDWPSDPVDRVDPVETANEPTPNDPEPTPNDPDGPWGGLGNNMGAMRLKPREESESDSEESETETGSA